MRVAIDTNFLVYAEGMNGITRRDQAAATIDPIPAGDIVIPAQVLGELYNVLTRKGGLPRDKARELVLDWRNRFAVIGTSEGLVARAMDLAVDHRMVIWDAIILAAAAEAGCAVLLSEDMQDGFTWGGVTIVNPFASQPHPLLARLLRRPH